MRRYAQLPVRQVAAVTVTAATNATTGSRSAFSTPAPPQPPVTSALTTGATSAAAAAAAEVDGVAAATEQLRAALQAWSAVEQQKAAAAAVTRTQAVRDRAGSSSSYPVPRPLVSTGPTITNPTATTAATAAPGAGDASTSSAPSADKASQSASFTWIRNKKPKFWGGMVYADGGASPSAASPASSANSQKEPSAVSASSQLSSLSSVAQTSSAAATAANAQTAASVRTPTTRDHMQPFRNRYKRDVARRLSKLLDKDPALGPALLGGLSAESRRLLLVMGTASEYFGDGYEKLVQQVKAADRDKDSLISGHEYEQWATDSFAKRPRLHQGKMSADGTGATTSVSTAHHASTVRAATASPTTATSLEKVGNAATAGADAVMASPASATSTQRKDKSPVIKAVQQHPGKVMASGQVARSDSFGPSSSRCDSSDGETNRESTGSATTPDSSYIAWPTYRRLLIAAAAPFMAFGILDNGTLILAGDAVDRYVSESLNLSAMAAAAVGGVVSGVAGIQVHGLAERWTRSTPPQLTAAQYRSRAYMSSERIGNTVGMVVGLILGMTPLLLIGGSSADEDVAEDAARLQKEADRTRKARRQVAAVTRTEHEERGLVEFEERGGRVLLKRAFDDVKAAEAVLCERGK